MKKFFTLIAAALMAVGVNAQEKLPLTGGWGSSVNASGTVELTANSQWGEYKLATENFSIADYPQFKVTYSGCEGDWQMKIENGTKEGQYMDISADANEVAGTFDTEKFGADPTITYFEIQSKTGEGKITIEKVELIDKDGKSVETSYTNNWGVDALVFGGVATFTSQWAQLGQWNADFSDGDVHTYTITLNTPAPENFQFKIDKPENYIEIPAGESTFSFELKEAYENVSIQFKGEENGTIDIASVTRTITNLAGINDITSDSKAKNNVRYNLLGVKNGNGIYIMNGKKYMK